jgi:diacylglycerol kinase (ATP)
MNVVLLYNAISGNGSATQVCERLKAELRRAGHDAHPVEASNGSTGARLKAPLQGADALVVLGGDGTVHSAADAAISAGTPLYHVPMGTENLFAREFGMSRSIRRLVRSLDAGEVREVDTGVCGSRTFLIMSSIGPDASVIHRMERARRGAISHLSYLRPILGEAASPSLSPLTVTVDGRRVVENQSGLLVVANSRQYALRIDPARDASMTDAMLDVVFFPARSRARLLAWALWARLGRHRRTQSLVYEQGSSVQVQCEHSGMPVQLDGEAAGDVGRQQTALQFGVGSRRLRVLVPQAA